MAALSLATDLAMGQPMEYAVGACILAVRLRESMGLSEAELREVYYEALLRYIGCNAETGVLATIVGDEQAMRRDFAAIDPANTPHVIRLVSRYIGQANQGASPLQLARSIVHGLLHGARHADWPALRPAAERKDDGDRGYRHLALRRRQVGRGLGELGRQRHATAARRGAGAGIAARVNAVSEPAADGSEVEA